MKTWKILIIVAVALAGLVVLSATGVIFYFRSKQAELIQMGDRAKNEGSAFGSGKSGELCLTEGLKRVDACDGIGCKAESRIFMKYCLLASSPGIGCTDVPQPTEILSTAQWSVEKCKALGKRQVEDCARAIRAVQEVCYPQ